MINLNVFSQALKITWLRRILQKESKWQVLIKTISNIKNVFVVALIILIQLYKM